ncbi:MAG: EamA family transporter [Elusimicrobia bacterium]|nr:EamA family transporter [Elusimicrobiota bacterium]
MIRATVFIWIAVLASSLSNVLTSRGMQAMGPLEDCRPGPLLRYGLGAVSNKWVLLGLMAGMANFMLWLIVLSWADVSWALPMNAVEYAVTAGLAAWWLKERVAVRRWLGIGLISGGVACVMGSW